jgi:hypothetical protein
MFKTHVQQQAEIQLATEELAERVVAARFRMRVVQVIAVILGVVALGMRYVMRAAATAKGLTEAQRMEIVATHTNYIWLLLVCLFVAMCVAVVLHLHYRSLKFELFQMRALP